MDSVRFRLGLADSLGLGNLVPVTKTKQNLITYSQNLYAIDYHFSVQKERDRSWQLGVTSISPPPWDLLATIEEIRAKYLSSRGLPQRRAVY